MGKHKEKKSKKDSSVPDNEEESAVDTPGSSQEDKSGPEEEKHEARLLRLQADFENFRKRISRERDEWYQNANEELIIALLPVLDHFEMGLHTAEKHRVDQSVIDGFRMVYSQLEQTLSTFRLEPIDADGKDFDPHQHEAITYVPSEEHPVDTVIAQTRRGYKLGEKLIRPAQVVVSSGSSEKDSAEEHEKSNVNDVETDD